MNKKKLLISMLCCVICCGVLSAASIGEDEFFPLGEGGLNSGHFLRDYVVYDGVTKTIHYPIFDEELLNKVKEHDSNINSLDQLQFYNFVKGWNYRWDGAGKNCFQDFSEYEKLVVEFTEAIPYEVMLKVQGDELADDDNGKHQNAKGSRTVIAKASAGAIAMSLNLKEATEEFSANALTTEQLQNIEYVYFQMNYPTDRGALLKLKNVYLTKKSDNNAQVTVTTQGLKAVKDKVVTEVSFYSPSIVRIQKYDENANVAKHELVVTLSPENVSMTSEQNETLVTLRSDETTVTFNKTNGQIIFYDKDGNQTLYEKADACEITGTKDGAFDSYIVKQTFTLGNDEPIYGLGQLQNGEFSQRGKTYWDMVQGNTSVWIPYIHSVKGYALYWDNYSPTTFADDERGMSFESKAGCGVNYYYLGGSAESGAYFGDTHPAISVISTQFVFP